LQPFEAVENALPLDHHGPRNEGGATRDEGVKPNPFARHAGNVVTTCGEVGRQRLRGGRVHLGDRDGTRRRLERDPANAAAAEDGEPTVVLAAGSLPLQHPGDVHGENIRREGVPGEIRTRDLDKALRIGELLDEEAAGVRTHRRPRTAHAERYEKSAAMLSTEATEPIERTEPTEPIERIEPDEPMARIEPAEPIERIEPDEAMERIEPDDPVERSEPLRGCRRGLEAVAGTGASTCD